MMSTTRMVMSQRDEPRDLHLREEFENDAAVE